MITFADHATTDDLNKWGRLGDVQFAVRTWPTGYPHKLGDTWSFWMEDDPRTDSGIVPLCSYRCVESGDRNAQWEKLR